MYFYSASVCVCVYQGFKCVYIFIYHCRIDFIINLIVLPTIKESTTTATTHTHRYLARHQCIYLSKYYMVDMGL